MTAYLFETLDGKIEVTRKSDTGKSEGEAYFFFQDYLADIDASGMFADWFGKEYQVVYPYNSDAILQVIEPRTIARAAHTQTMKA